jgi:hypothetical protein
MAGKFPFDLEALRRPGVLEKMTMQDKKKLFVLFSKMPTPKKHLTKEFGREDPRDFVRDVLGVKPTQEALAHGYTDPWTPDQERIMLSVMQHQKTAVPSGHSCGKTVLAAWLALWFLYRRAETTVVTTATTARQVEKVLWKEIRQYHANSNPRLPGRVLLTEIDVGGSEEKWFATGFTAAKNTADITATAFQGLHNKHVLVIYDEAIGVPDGIKEGGDSLVIRPDDRALAIANPTDPAAWFKKACDDWNMVQMSCEDHPNVIHNNPDIIPGAVTQVWIDGRLAEYGHRDSPLFRSKVLGLFPDQSSDSLISLGWVERAQRIVDEEEDDLGVALGLDIADEGEDLTVMFACKNRRTFIPKLGGRYAWHVGRDVMQAVKLVKKACLEIPDIRVIALDDTGLGKGVTARLNEMNEHNELPRFRHGISTEGKSSKIRILPVNFGSGAWDKGRFAYTKDQLWWTGREALRNDEILLPSDEEMSAYGLPPKNSLPAQLTNTLYSLLNGKIACFDKRGARGAAELTKLLPDKSPDLAHAWLLCLWARGQTPRREKVEPIRNTQDAFDLETREIIERSTKSQAFMRGKNRGPKQMPYQRSGMAGRGRRRMR